MARIDAPRREMLRRLNTAVLFVLVLAFAGVILSLVIDVQQRLSALGSASSDSVQWALSQLEVETQLLRESTAAPDADLADVRKRFDILYSRIRIIDTGSMYADLRRQEQFAAQLASVTAFVDSAIPLIDGPDAALRAALPDLHEKSAALREAVRTISLMGLNYFSAESDMQRTEVARTLRRVALLTAALVVALSVLSAVLMRLYQRSRAQALENRLTGARLETIVSSSIDAIAVTTTRGEVLEFNPAAEAIFGYTRAEAMQGEITELVLPPEKAELIEAEVEAELRNADGRLEGTHRFEIEAMRKDRSRFPAELSVAAVSQPNGTIYVSFLRDISDRQTAERDLTEARDRALEGEKAKAEFLAVMSHEMRTPLNGLLGSVEILGATPLTDTQREILDVIETSGQVLLHHVNSVLDISSAEVGAIRPENTPFVLEALVREVVANQTGLAATAGNRIVIVPVTDPVGRVTGDPARLRQILLNLVGNAVKFTRNGTITVEIEAEAPVGDTRVVELRVIDTGVGIAEADQARIFEDFVTLDTSYGRETGGTGLGLGITRRLVTALGGRIGIESEPGQGSVFWVRLPFGGDPEATATPVEARGDVVDPALHPQSVLVIEDNAINRFVLRALLEEVHHKVTEAVDGLEGVALAAAEAHDLILMDISMPRLDGVEAAQRIRAGKGLSKNARIVAVTAHALPEELARFRAAGIDDCLVKPVTRGALTRILSGGRAPSRTPGRKGAEAPLIDGSQLNDLTAQLDETTFRHLLGRFTAEADEGIPRLVACPPDPESDRLCHRLAGSAATFGAVRLADLLRAMERALPTGIEAFGVQAQLVDLWRETRAELVARQPFLSGSGPLPEVRHA